jgi:cytochrome c biogenesis protein CcmG, thiol:disulfide interchange protein DsbE
VDEPVKPHRLWFRSLQVLALAFVAGLLVLFTWRLIDKGKGGELVSAVASAKRPSAPAFELPVLWTHLETWPAAARGALGDGRVSLAELRGFPVVLNFWASWCVPCKKEAPRLGAAAKAHRGDVVFLGIDVQDFKSDARRFLTRYEVNYVSLRDGGDSTYSAYGLTGLPETYYIDAQGRIVAHDIGEVSKEELETGIAELADASPP